MQEERYLFLGGHRKCGTTLLLNLLDGHTGVCAYPTDISVLYGYFPVWTASGCSDEEKLDRLDQVVFGTLQKLRSRHGLEDALPVETMRGDFFDNLDRRGLGEIDLIIRQIIRAYRNATRQDVAERPLVVIKETSSEIYGLELAEKFPGAQFLGLVRDPRDNLGALRAGIDKHYRKFGEEERHILASMIHRTSVGLKMIERNRRVMGEKRVRSLPFEDLVGDCERVMLDVADFLGIAFERTLTSPTVMGRPTTGNNYDGKVFKEVTAENISKWRERISAFEAKVIEFHLESEMKDYGYLQAFNEREQAEAAAEFYKWANYEYFFKDSFSAL